MENAVRKPAAAQAKCQKWVQIRCFGPLRIERDGEELLISSRKVKLLLALLLCDKNHKIERQTAANLLWYRHGEDNALTSLRQALAKLKNCLNSENFQVVEADRHSIWLNGALFVADLNDAYRAQTLAGIEQSALAGSWRQPLFEGLETHETQIQDWLNNQRCQLAQHFLQLLEGALAASPAQQESQVLQAEKQRLSRQFAAAKSLETMPPGAVTEASESIEVRESSGNAKSFNRSPPTSETLKKYQQYLRQKVEHFWIAGVYENSCGDEDFIDLKLSQEPRLIHQPFDGCPVQLTFGNQQSETFSAGELLKRFNNNHGQMLLVGAPASGKTTLLLNLIKRILEITQAMPSAAIPVLVNASSWKPSHACFKSWLLEEMDKRYDIPRQVGEELLSGDYLVLFVDGVDEIDRLGITQFTEAVNDFLKNHPGQPLCLATRKQEYIAAQSKFRIFNAACIQAITADVLNKHIKKSSGRLDYLLDLEPGKQLRVLTNPLTIKAAQRTFHDSNGHFFLSASPEKMIGNYFENLIPDNGISKTIDRNLTLRYLKELATIMKADNQAIFNVESLTATEVLPPIWACFARVLALTIITLTVAITISYMSWLHFQDIHIALLPYPFAVVGILVVSLLGENGEKRLLPRLSLTLSALTRGWKSKLPISLYASVSVGLCSTWIFGLSHGLVMGVAMLLLFVLWACLDFETPTQPREDFGKPNEIIHRSLKNALIGASIGGGVGLLADLILASSGPQPMLSILFGFVSFFILGGHSALQHYIIRLILALSGRMPLRVSRFVVLCTKHRILYRVGGGLIFPHALIRDYLAKRR